MAEHCFTKARLGPQIWTWFWSNWKHQKNTHNSSFEMIFRFWSWLPNCIHLVIGKMCTVILAKFKVYTGKETTFSFARMKKILKKKWILQMPLKNISPLWGPFLSKMFGTLLLFLNVRMWSELHMCCHSLSHIRRNRCSAVWKKVFLLVLSTGGGVEDSLPKKTLGNWSFTISVLLFFIYTRQFLNSSFQRARQIAHQRIVKYFAKFSRSFGHHQKEKRLQQKKTVALVCMTLGHYLRSVQTFWAFTWNFTRQT